MRKWGLLVTLFYAVLVLALLVPLGWFLMSSSPLSLTDLKQVYQHQVPWICTGAVVLGEILLLWLTVDMTEKRLKPRAHILVSATITGFFLAILSVAVVMSLGLALRGDIFFPGTADMPLLFGTFGIPWLVWGILFYRFCRNSSDPVTRVVAWLLRGSVLELLIAVPSHVIVRRRNDCSAPVVTGFGISTGIAIMLLSFGPSVILLYKKRMESYSTKAPAAK